jgi:sugar lactone lactonase YvrE
MSDIEQNITVRKREFPYVVNGFINHGAYQYALIANFGLLEFSDEPTPDTNLASGEKDRIDIEDEKPIWRRNATVIDLQPSEFNLKPNRITVDQSNNLYVLFSESNSIMKINLNGTIETVYDDQTANEFHQPTLDYPMDILLYDNDSKLLIADTNHHKIRSLDLNSKAMSDVVGTGTSTFNGDGLLALDTNIDTPAAVALGNDGNLYFSEGAGRRIRRLDLDGIVTRIAGTGTEASTNTPFKSERNGVYSSHSIDIGTPIGLAVYENDLYFSSLENAIVMKLDLTGYDGFQYEMKGILGGRFGDPYEIRGESLSNTLRYPESIFVSKNGHLYVCDTGNWRIVESDLEGNVLHIYGGIGPGSKGNFNPWFGIHVEPSDLNMDRNGNLFITDSSNTNIRMISADPIFAEDVFNEIHLINSQTPTLTPTVNVVQSTPTPSPTITPIPTPVENVDEIIVSQGTGGNNIVSIRNFDENANEPLTAQIESIRALNEKVINQIGGGEGRNTYVSTGDINQDGFEDIIFSFSQLRGPAEFPNIIIPFDLRSKQPIGHPFSAFPKGFGTPVHYSSGELRTEVGNYLQSKVSLLAVAQGFGSQAGLVRLFEFTTQPAPGSWRIVSQFQPLDDKPAQNNLHGGVTLSSGDLDNDGLDELVVGQTNSATSLTQFTVIDLVTSGNHIRHNYVGFPLGFRGQGGIETTVADLNGDGINEIVVAGKGYNGTNDTGNVLSIIHPIIINNQITGFTRPENSIIKVIGDDSINPGGGLSIASGELDGDSSNGEEIIFGSGEGAPQSFYRVMKINYDPGLGENGTVTSFSYLIGPPKNLDFVVNAFVNEFNPSSGAVFVETIDYQ